MSSVTLDAETIERLDQCMPDENCLEDRIKQMCESYSQIYEVSADAIQLIDKLEMDNNRLKEMLVKAGSLSAMLLQELEKASTAETSESPVLNWACDFLQCSPADLQNVVIRLTTDRDAANGKIRDVCSSLGCGEDDIPIAIADRLSVRNSDSDDIARYLQCEVSEVGSRLGGLLDKEALLGRLCSAVGTDVATIEGMINDVVAGNDGGDLARENAELRRRGSAVAVERDELQRQLNRMSLVDYHRSMDIETHASVFEKQPQLEKGEDEAPVTEETMWSTSYELRNAHETIKGLQAQRREENGKLESEVRELRTAFLRERTMRQTVETENADLKSQIETSPSSRILRNICDRLDCPRESEIQQKVAALQTEIMFLKAQRGFEVAVAAGTAPSEDTASQLRQESAAFRSELAGTRTELYKYQQEVTSAREMKTKLEAELRQKDNTLLQERKQRMEAEIARDSIQNDLRLTRTSLREATGQCEASVRAANAISSGLDRFVRRNTEMSDFCRALNSVFSRFYLLDFRRDPTEELIHALSRVRSGGSGGGDMSDLRRRLEGFATKATGEIWEVGNAVSRLSGRVSKVESKMGDLREMTNNIIDALREKQEELEDLMENDMAPLAMSLQCQLKALQEERPEAHTMTPPRGMSMGSRSSMSPSDVVLESLIRQHDSSYRMTFDT